MKNVYKIFLTAMLGILLGLPVMAQDSWSKHVMGSEKLETDKAVARLSFPKEFKLYDLNMASLKQNLFSIVGNHPSSHSTIISLPNADGQMEQFNVVEASNFEPALQAQFPEIRAFSGSGITDKGALLKLSISPQGIQTMIFRNGKESEFIEPYSKDHTVYAVFISHREKNRLPWACTTEDKNTASELKSAIVGKGTPPINNSSAGQLKTMRLAQSVTAEYSNFFGATSVAQVGLVLAAVNNTITRCNGVYEKDLAVHLNLVANTTSVFYYDPTTDPYATVTNAFAPPGSWNSSLQTTLTSIIGEANYDIGHLFGASGGGGNAGCIGCVCVDGQKGSGITSPATGTVNPSTSFPPSGDGFDIDYVVHEIGHQLGATHTFTFSGESGSSSQKEVGSGITIMGYAGITSQDVAPHSLDIYHETSIAQIQANLAGKTCPVTTTITANNATPVVPAVANAIIPISTPFELRGAATDANPADVLTYCWEQNDNTNTLTGAASIASQTKLTGPNWLSFAPSTNPIRTCPILATVLAGNFVTGVLPGGDPGTDIEALSSVARDLNFRLTVRDNHPYSSTAPIAVGQTQFTDMVVTVSATSGPFMVTVPNTALTWTGGTSQTITWAVANTTAAPVSCANVKISLSTDGGLTFPTVLAASTPNDGTETLLIPNTPTTTARIKIESVGNIFFDISNTNFTIVNGVPSFDFATAALSATACNSATTASVTLGTISNLAFVTPIALTSSGAPAGTTVTFVPNPVVPGSNTVVTLNNANTLAAGTYTITVTGTAGAIVRTKTIDFIISATPTITTQPAAQNICAGGNATFTVVGTNATSYQWQVSTDGGLTWANVAGATAATYTFATTAADNTKRYRCILTNSCGTVTSSNALLTITAGSLSGLSIVADAGTTLCQGDPTRLTAVASAPGTITATTGAIAVTIPDANATGISVPVTIAGVPAGATLTSISTTFNITHTWDGDLTIYLKSPSAKVINLSYANGGSGDNYTNTVFSSTATLAITGGTPPFTNTFIPQGNAGAASPTGFTQTDATFAALMTNVGTNINGVWSLGVRDNAGGDVGTILSFGVSLNYVVNGPLTTGTFVWSPAAGLNSTTTNPVAASPATTTTYTLNYTGGLGCVSTASVTITVNPRPSITTQPTATSVCANSSATITAVAAGAGLTYQWQSGTTATGPWTVLANAAPYSGVNTASLVINPAAAALDGLYYQLVVSGTCSPAAKSTAVKLTVVPLPSVSVTPATSCGGIPGINGVLLSTGSLAPPIPGSATFSNAATVAVPDNSAAGATSAITVSGIPANATITNVTTTLNMSHTYPGDMIFNLKNPNGTIANLYKYNGGTGTGAVSGPPTWGWYGAKVSGPLTGNVAFSSIPSPYIYNATTNFKPDLIDAAVAGVTIQNPTGYVSNCSSWSNLYTATPTGPNGVWTLAMADGGAGDVGSLAGWSLKIDYTTPGGAGSALTYTWSPATGLYIDASCTIPYVAGTQTPTVYAAPGANTIYTATGTNSITGCSGTGIAYINATPAAPVIITNPSPATICFGKIDTLKLAPTSCTSSRTGLTKNVPDNIATGVSDTLAISCVPVGASITSMQVTMNVTHTWVGDMIINLKAPNGTILNLAKYLGGTFGTGATTGLINTTFTSVAGAPALSSGSGSYSSTFRPDNIDATIGGVTVQNPTGFVSNAGAAGFSALYSVPNGNWILALADGGPADLGVLKSWSITVNYGVPPLGVWSVSGTSNNYTGLYSNAALTTQYTGTATQQVYAAPTSTTTYQVNVTGPLPNAAVTNATNFANNNLNALVTFNVKNNNTSAVKLTGVSGIASAAGATTVNIYAKPGAINGLPGAISAANGWINIGTANITAAGTVLEPFISGLTYNIPAGATVGIVVEALSGGAANLAYSTLTAGTYTFSQGGVDIVTGTNIGYGGVAAPGAPTFTPRGFIGSITYDVLTPQIFSCSSANSLVTVTVLDTVKIITKPTNASICTGTNAMFTVTATGTGLTYQWQTSMPGGTFVNIVNGANYSGATTNTLSVINPPASWNGRLYQVVVSGTCGSKVSPQNPDASVVLTVPSVSITALPTTSLYPGLTTNLTANVIPVPASYAWYLDGVLQPTRTTKTINVGIDGVGLWTVQSSDGSGCTNTSNAIAITDSANGHVFIYPNPNNGVFQVRYYGSNNKLPRGLNIYDDKGSRVEVKYYSNITSPYQRMDVDLRRYGKGIYWVEVVDVDMNRLAMGRVISQ